jgi:hypothetical protein
MVIHWKDSASVFTEQKYLLLKQDTIQEASLITPLEVVPTPTIRISPIMKVRIQEHCSLSFCSLIDCTETETPAVPPQYRQPIPPTLLNPSHDEVREDRPGRVLTTYDDL